MLFFLAGCANKQTLTSSPVSPAYTKSATSGCHVGPRGGTYTLTASGRKNYAGC